MPLSERVVGVDPQGIRRIFAPTTLEASLASQEYIKARPDTGPLSDWRFFLERLCNDIVIAQQPLDDEVQYD